MMNINREVARHAYENVLTACARLAAFASCRPTESEDDLIDKRQHVLALDDLVSFAIYARRLMDSTSTLAQFAEVKVDVISADAAGTVAKMAITRVINIVVHHRNIEIYRFERERLKVHDKPTVEAIMEYKRLGKASFPPAIIVQSDKSGKILVRLSTLINVFEQQVMLPIVWLCQDQGVHLCDDY